MSQRVSGYARKENDLYETPNWVTLALFPHLPRMPKLIWEPAAGSGKLAAALPLSSRVQQTDKNTGCDFLTSPPPVGCDAIITNPPYGQAQAFIDRALELMEPVGGFVAMLLRTDYDHAKTRHYLFGAHPAFSKKVVLTKRIVWFERKGAAPSFNHAWFIWDWQHSGAPTLAYAA